MGAYKLEDNPDIYISAYIDNRFIYRMVYANDESNSSLIRDIDLRKDTLTIYGTEIQESILQKLHDSLILRKRTGNIYVNCNGACYIAPIGKGVYRPIDNVIFDWSPFGVMVPNSINDSLGKQLQQKEQKLVATSTQLSLANREASINKASLEASKQEIKELKEQFLTCQKDRENMEIELQKVRSQLSLKEFELETIKIEFESSKEEVKESKDQYFACHKDKQSTKIALQMVQDQLSFTMSELQYAKSMLETSEERLIELEEQLSTSGKESEDMKAKLQKMQDELSSVKSTLQFTDVELELSNKNKKVLECQLSSCRKENQDIITELQRVQNEISCGYPELQSTKSQSTSSHSMIKKLEEQLSTCKNIQDQQSLIINDLQSIKMLLELTEKEVEWEDQSLSECYIIKAVQIVDG